MKPSIKTKSQISIPKNIRGNITLTQIDKQWYKTLKGSGKDFFQDISADEYIRRSRDY